MIAHVHNDHRLFERLDKTLRVKCSWQGGQKSRIEGTGVDVSGGGMRVSFPQINTDSRDVSLEIIEPGGPRPIQAKARMVWRDKPGGTIGLGAVLVGFEFLDVSLAGLGGLFPSSKANWYDNGGLPQD